MRRRAVGGAMGLLVVVIAVIDCDLEEQARRTGMDAEIDQIVAQTKIDAEAWAAAQTAATARATTMRAPTTTLSPVEAMTPLVKTGSNAGVARLLADVRCRFSETRGLIERIVCLDAPPELTCAGALWIARAGMFEAPVMVQLLSTTKRDVFVEPDSEGTFAHPCNGVYETTAGRRLGPMPPKG